MWGEALTCQREDGMDKPRIFLGSSGKQAKLLEVLTRGLEEVAQVEPWTTILQSRHLARWNACSS